MADQKQEPGPGGRLTPSWTIKPVGPEEASVGAMMRKARESRGLSIEDVSAVLKIRRDNLAAIEESRVNDLPGLPYAIGFVRTYADYLDMDGAAAVEKFKGEIAGTEEETELAFPMPVRERRFPGALAVGGSLLVAAAVYGAWFFLWSGAEPAMDAPTEPEFPAVAESVTAPTDKPAARPEETQPEEARPAEDTGEAEAVASAPPPQGEGRDETQAETPAAESREAAAPAAPAEETVTTAEPPEPPEPAEPPPAEETVSTAEPAPPQAAESEDDSVSQEATAAPMAAPGPSRVEIRATADSWVQIRDADNKIVFARVLREGESYRVPDLPGLAMVTGNAGALSVLVDGKPIEPLGPLGAVRRNILLDADSLLAGQ